MVASPARGDFRARYFVMAKFTLAICIEKRAESKRGEVKEGFWRTRRREEKRKNGRARRRDETVGERRKEGEGKGVLRSENENGRRVEEKGEGDVEDGKREGIEEMEESGWILPF
uniref:Uncharacterized protein n=1 Tax=Vespula pensylvanica TaxID=30213 RepID=A0A834P2P3_VESPE|nr:hypothetical protein H0235_008141 [Vespula pensylvanica]